MLRPTKANFETKGADSKADPTTKSRFTTKILISSPVPGSQVAEGLSALGTVRLAALPPGSHLGRGGR